MRMYDERTVKTRLGTYLFAKKNCMHRSNDNLSEIQTTMYADCINLMKDEVSIGFSSYS